MRTHQGKPAAVGRQSAAPPSTPDEIREQFKIITTNVGRNVDRWAIAMPAPGRDSQFVSTSELNLILHDMDHLPEESRPSDLRWRLHDFRSKIAVVTNALSLLKLVEQESDRKLMAVIIKRNLGDLMKTVELFCDEIPVDNDQDHMAELLANASRKLNNLFDTTD